jgi:predicted NUDIX family phosphoesterase
MSFKDSYKQVITDTINGVDVADKLHDILQAKLQARLREGKEEQYVLTDRVLNTLTSINDVNTRVNKLCLAIDRAPTEAIHKYMSYKNDDQARLDWIKSDVMKPIGLTMDTIKSAPQFNKFLEEIDESFEAHYHE